MTLHVITLEVTVSHTHVRAAELLLVVSATHQTDCGQVSRCVNFNYLPLNLEHPH